MDMPRPGTTWRDVMLERSARGRLDLPLVVQERSRRDQHRRILRFAAIAAIALAIANAAIFGGTGSLSGLTDPKLRDPNLPTIAAVVLLAVPLGVAVLIYGIFWFATVRGMRDDDGHPWRIEATEHELVITRADSTRLAAPWSRWSYESYRFTTYNGAPIAVTALALSLDGRAMVIDLRRASRPRRLLRAILQRLAAHGRATG
jgi:hypothetical protein